VLYSSNVAVPDQSALAFLLLGTTIFPEIQTRKESLNKLVKEIRLK
jgi:hypothetical protein